MFAKRIGFNLLVTVHGLNMPFYVIERPFSKAAAKIDITIYLTICSVLQKKQ